MKARNKKIREEQRGRGKGERGRIEMEEKLKTRYEKEFEAGWFIRENKKKKNRYNLKREGKGRFR